MKQFFYLIFSIFILNLPLRGVACTSAIVSAQASATGRPLLWKNRDTSTLDNKVEYVAAAADGSMSYVALFNAPDPLLREAWIGMNEAGFAVMNTASYNLKDDDVPASKMDKEGEIMTLALKHCRSLQDFEHLLSTLPRPLGVEANFGAIDALGQGAYYECNNHSYTKFDIADAPSGVLVRTNYSHSGRPGEGFGQIRERNAWHLLSPHLKNKTITPATFILDLSCSHYHDLFGKDMLPGSTWLIDQDFIPRYTTTASIVIEGILPNSGETATMWTAIGYPPCAELFAVTCSPTGVVPDLQGTLPGGKCPAGERAATRKQEVFRAPDGNASRYIYVPALTDSTGRGYLQTLKRQNQKTYDRLHSR